MEARQVELRGGAVHAVIGHADVFLVRRRQLVELVQAVRQGGRRGRHDVADRGVRRTVEQPVQARHFRQLQLIQEERVVLQLPGPATDLS